MKTLVLMHPRAEELLVERAIRPLTEAETAELAALGISDDLGVEMAAAAIAIAETPYEAMPASVLARLTAPLNDNVIPIQPRAAAKRRAPVVWIAATLAACIAVAIGLVVWRGAGSEVSPQEARAALAREAKPLPWTPTADAAAKGATGDVVWSTAKQQGYMRFVGLAANDPKAWQYQLWIFDRTRDEAYPVDGGVFDVSSTGEVIVPISPKLHVDDATLFAVTVERPGGVVVSKRERIVVTAKAS